MSKPRSVLPDFSVNPHGALFRYTFSDPANAAPLLKLRMPRDLAASIDWSTLRHLEVTFVAPEDERAGYADLVFAVVIGGRDGFVYMILDLVRDDAAVQRLVAVGCARLLGRADLRGRHPEAPTIVPYVLRV